MWYKKYKLSYLYNYVYSKSLLGLPFWVRVFLQIFCFRSECVDTDLLRQMIQIFYFRTVSNYILNQSQGEIITQNYSPIVEQRAWFSSKPIWKTVLHSRKVFHLCKILKKYFILQYFDNKKTIIYPTIYPYREKI